MRNIESGVICTLDCITGGDIVFSEEITCTNGKWTSQRYPQLTNSKIQALEKICPKNQTGNVCTILQGANFLPSCTLNGEAVYDKQLLPNNTECDIACNSALQNNIMSLKCIGSNQWMWGRMQMSGERILQSIMEICQKDNRTCPPFDKDVPSGVWECISGGKDIINGWWSQKCSLKCDGQNSSSVDLICKEGKWRKVIDQGKCFNYVFCFLHIY